MTVIFKTYLPYYKNDSFPDNITIPPRIGEKVLYEDTDHCIEKGITSILEVIDVTWMSEGVVCQLGNKTK
jgi:hypothetical protein